jgi:CheY-specific phosphatase CheX
MMTADEIYEFLDKEYFPVFKEAFMDSTNRMTKTLLTYKEEYTATKAHKSLGMTVIIGIIGKFPGRLLLDLSKETAKKLASSIYRKETIDDHEVVAVLGEFSNIIAGNACSMLNRKNKALSLRLAPPSILSGESVLISASAFKTRTAVAHTEFGEMLLNIGFEKREDEWL